MGQIVTSLVLFVIFLAITAEPAVTASQENRSSYPDSGAIYSRTGLVRGAGGELSMLIDQMKQGDTLLTDRLKESNTVLKEMLKEGDTRLKEQLVESVAQVKEQVKRGDVKLQEDLDEDAAWLKGKLDKGENRLKEQMAEEERFTKEKLAEQKDAFEKLQNSVKEWTQRNNAVMDSLKQQMSDVQKELQDSATSLKSTRDQLNTTQTELTATRDTLQSTRDALQATQTKVTKTEEELLKSREQLRTAEDEVQSLKVKVNTLESTHRGRPESPSLRDVQDFTDVGSTFTRWGRTSCPDNTSLVYSGIVGGSHYDHTGGASNYLCLVMDPQLDNTTVSNTHSFVYGAEYEHVTGHHDHDVMCSVCRAPQATTLMIPATLTCPLGWTTQYTGHLMTSYYKHKRGTEYVCMDLVRENRPGGHENNNGALFYYVVSACGSLPCPPYVNNKIVTCVVCSL